VSKSTTSSFSSDVCLSFARALAIWALNSWLFSNWAMTPVMSFDAKIEEDEAEDGTTFREVNENPQNQRQ
jgi:hypothetical protein